MKKVHYLKKVPLLEGLTESDMEKLKKIGKVKKLKEGQVIFDEDTAGGHFYVVMGGRVKIFTTSGSKKKTLAYLGKGEFFGEMALLDMEPRSASSEAVDDSELFVVKKQDFKKLLLKHPDMSFKIMKTLCHRLRQADKEIEALSFGNVVGRIAAALLGLAKKYGDNMSLGTRIKVVLNHKDIAELAGTGREMVSRILNRFKRLNCITYANRHLIITDAAKLKQWVQ